MGTGISGVKVLYKCSSRNKKAIEEYIRKQLQEDIAYDQLNMKKFIKLFIKEKKQNERRNLL